MDILVILEDNHGSLHRISKEAIVAAQKIGGSISAIIIGENCLKIAKTLSTINIHEVITVNHHLVKSYNADGYSEILKQVIQGHNPKIIICGHTYQARDYIPRISAKLNIPFIPDAIAINNNQYTKQVLNAKLNATCSTNANCLILSVQSAAFNEIEIEQRKI